MTKEISIVKNCALNFLVRREHSQYELRNKLRLRKFDSDLIDKVIQELANQKLQSDERFVESYVQMRCNRGYGPVRIAAELQARGVKEELIFTHINESDELWLGRMMSVHRKKFGKKIPKNFLESAKQMRFLQYRGFTKEQIRHYFKAI